MNGNLENIRARNLDFLRWRFGGHKTLASKLSSILNWKYLSDSALGSKSISDSTARAIETRLGYTRGWLDRNNFEAFECSEDDFELFVLVQKAPPEIKMAVRTILKAYQ